ncbi:hypothetical protein HD806DRAFT_542819 [Xylariaceae sp. AK1471]|nr:hypothetical protein HD806DRAFT_542819 [Xylariaceae sp. AK1471]
MVNDSQSRGQYPPRQSLWYPGRTGAEHYSEDGRLTESPETRRPPWTITKSLRELCQIPGNNFFVASEENGKVICLSTRLGSQQLDHHRFFDENAFIHEINRVQLADNQSFDESELDFNTDVNPCAPETNRARTQDRRHNSERAVDSFANDGARRSKKRPRAGSTQRGISNMEDNIPMVTIQPKRGIRIGDGEAVYAFYDQRFRSCQQAACKIIAKAWVKAVEPKKQSTHPYTRGDETRPDWWPKTYTKFGSDVVQGLRHKEPDHLGKDERVFLLCHILRMLVEPQHKQHHAIRKVNLNLGTLEAVTFEALSTWFSDKATPSNLSKKAVLKEIFKVARQEERFKDNGIDGLTEVFVNALADTKTSKGSASDSDDEDGGLDQNFTPASSSASSVEPTAHQIMMPQVQPSEHSEASHFPGNSFADNVPIRTAHYSHTGFDPELSERPSYVEAPGMANHAPNYGHGHLGLPEMYTSPQGTSRRSSVFNSPSEYGSPATPAMYTPWQTSNAPSTPSMYGYPPQQSSVQTFGGQMAQGPSYVVPSIDGLPRHPPDAHHGNMFASRGVGQGAVHHQPGYSNYVTDAASLVGPGVKTEGGPHPSVPQ